MLTRPAGQPDIGHAIMTFRFSLGRLMLAVAFIALVILGGIDFVFWRPVRRVRREMIARHERVAARYAWELAREIPHHPLEDDLKRDLHLASEWHSRRAREIHAAARFDPATEDRQDQEQSPSDMNITGRLNNSRMISSD